ncbi:MULTISPECIES: plasmid recombination protein [Rhizobium]|uniref:plasmid recombination protein n=1 Tax=Rhizobium TaxID=379 RepID=UPI001A908A46|nr:MULTISPECIES: plasmid recombination protein [Rhizobium]MBN9981864.1 hypothetical protein [Rhizobium laguerreae]MBY5660698.1 hypothetical protein [Rhizobium leguminosarum]MBY5674733.1 hypothetical protein [Rhizobium leguminosarum]
MAYQFARLELYSRKGKEGRGTDFIFDEVARRPEASLHVRDPKRPEVVYGKDIDDLRALHDERAALAKVTVSGKPKAIRKDQNTLGTVIISHPATVEEHRADPAIQRDVLEWERRSIDWLKSRYGDELVTVVRHVDESHPHLHAYLVSNDPEMRAANFHPGFVAKNAIQAAGPRGGEDDKALKKRADRAYVDAMRNFLDDFHERVAIPSGLTRIGPKKRRLTRAEWQKEKTQAQALKKTVERARQVKASGEQFVARTNDEAAAIRAAANLEKEAATKATAVARAAHDSARKAQQQATDAVSFASRYSGLAGRVRAFWDGFRKSKIAAAIRQEFSGEIEHAKAFARSVQNRLKEEETRRIAAERKAHEATRDAEAARDAALRASIERDRAYSMLPPERQQELVAVGPAMKMTLRPSAKKDKR